MTTIINNTPHRIEVKLSEGEVYGVKARGKADVYDKITRYRLYGGTWQDSGLSGNEKTFVVNA